MKLRADALRARLAGTGPDPAVRAWLLFGPEPAETDALRAELAAALRAALGGEVDPVDPNALRRDAAALDDVLRANGLFGGRPVALVEGATDALAPKLAPVLDDLPADSGVLVATSRELRASSALRKLFEGARDRAAVEVRAEPMDRDALEAALSRAGNGVTATPEALDALVEAAAAMDPSAARGMVEILGLYMLNADGPATPADVATCRPDASLSDLDALADAVMARRPAEAAGALASALRGGGNATSAVLTLGSRMRRLHAVATAPGGPEAAVGALRPPVFGARRDALVRAARAWPVPALEAGLTAILDAELAIRSTGGPPDAAMAERLAVRLATLR